MSELIIVENLKTVFMGTSHFSAFVLNELIKAKYNIVGVVSQPNRRKGRRQLIQETEVAVLAKKHNLTLYQPDNIKTDNDFLIDLKPDLIITSAYGQIIPNLVLTLPKYGCINVHGSLLPKYRGAAPIQRAIMNGETKTGVTIMEMVEKMDAGAMISKANIIIEPYDNTTTIFEKMQVIASELLLTTLPKYINKQIIPRVQDETQVTFAPMLKKEEEYLDFNKDKQTLFNQVRALALTPGAFAYLKNTIVKIFEVEIIEKPYFGLNGQIVELTKESLIVKVIDGALAIKLLQPASKKTMTAQEYLNGQRDLLGEVFNKQNNFRGNQNG